LKISRNTIYNTGRDGISMAVNLDAGPQTWMNNDVATTRSSTSASSTRTSAHLHLLQHRPDRHPLPPQPDPHGRGHSGAVGMYLDGGSGHATIDHNILTDRPGVTMNRPTTSRVAASTAATPRSTTTISKHLVQPQRRGQRAEQHLHALLPDRGTGHRHRGTQLPPSARRQDRRCPQLRLPLRTRTPRRGDRRRRRDPRHHRRLRRHLAPTRDRTRSARPGGPVPPSSSPARTSPGPRW
jgi:hypothetical protein